MKASITITKERKNDVINKVVKTLEQGGLVVFPSDTVYGLLVDATNEQAVDKLIAFKNRPPGKAISVFVSGFDMMNTIAVVGTKQPLLDTLLPGPFTIILDSKHATSPKLESEKGTLGVRLPDYSLVQELVKSYGKPITATSANLGGRHPHYSIESLLKQLPKHKQELIDVVVDAGKLPRNKPSTILDLTTEHLKILRQGDIILKDSKHYKSSSPSQTHKLGAFIASTVSKEYKGKPVVCILKGDLGAGKTVLVKGMASYFGITDIVSPTFVIYYEYLISDKREEIKDKRYQKFVHADLYNIEDEEEFEHLGFEEYMKDGTMMCIEWGEKLGDMYKVLSEKAHVVYIEIKYVGEKGREVVIKS